MPLQLTTPIPVGGMDVADYTHVRILHFRMDVAFNRLDFRAKAGRIVDGEWYEGQINGPGTAWTVVVKDDEYATLIQTAGAAGSSLYDQVANSLYQHMIDKGLVAGTVV